MQKQFSVIESGFDIFVDTYKEILQGQIEDSKRYDELRGDYESQLRSAIRDVRLILFNNVSATYLTDDFKTSLMVSENISSDLNFQIYNSVHTCINIDEK